MATLSLQPRIWILDAELLDSIGFDSKSIQIHADLELEEDLDRHAPLLNSASAMPNEILLLNASLRQRHRAHWGHYSHA